MNSRMFCTGIAAARSFQHPNVCHMHELPSGSQCSSKGWPESADLLQRGHEGAKALGRLVHAQEDLYMGIAVASLPQ